MRVNQLEEQPPPKRRKSQRITRVVFETTEASVFEHIIEESRAIALDPTNEAKAREAARGPIEEGPTGPTANMRVHQAEKQTTGPEKAPANRRKSQRSTRIVHETTEASIFEHIVEKSRATALVPRNKAKAQEAARAPDEDGREAGLGEESPEIMLARKMRAKVEKELTEAPNDMEGDSSGMQIDTDLDEPEDAPPLSIHEAASRLIILGAEESPSAIIQAMKSDEAWHKVNFFEAFPPSGDFETSAERSTLPP